jgi:hypothetical protein
VICLIISILYYYGEIFFYKIKVIKEMVISNHRAAQWCTAGQCGFFKEVRLAPDSSTSGFSMFENIDEFLSVYAKFVLKLREEDDPRVGGLWRNAPR